MLEGWDGSGGAGVAPHFPNTQPPTFLPRPVLLSLVSAVGSPSLLRVPRFRVASLEERRERLSAPVFKVLRDKVAWAVAVQGVSSGPTDPAFPGVVRRHDEYSNCAGRDCKVCMSIPDTEIKDS